MSGTENTNGQSAPPRKKLQFDDLETEIKGLIVEKVSTIGCAMAVLMLTIKHRYCDQAISRMSAS